MAFFRPCSAEVTTCETYSAHLQRPVRVLATSPLYLATADPLMLQPIECDDASAGSEPPGPRRLQQRGHDRPVTALAFGGDFGDILCSASDDCVLLWRLPASCGGVPGGNSATAVPAPAAPAPSSSGGPAIAATMQTLHPDPSGAVAAALGLASSPQGGGEGSPSPGCAAGIGSLSFSPDAQLVAAACTQTGCLLAMDTALLRPLDFVCGHPGCTGAQFVDVGGLLGGGGGGGGGAAHNRFALVSVGEDRMFRVWDCGSVCLLQLD